jgi:hypothetical protein
MQASEVINFLEKFNIQCKFIPYEKIHEIKNINELMPCSLILYQLGGFNGVGHFCCIFYNDETKISYFDSFGNTPDYPLSYMTETMKKETKHDHKYLIKLLYENKGVDYNNTKLQDYERETCGKWCAIRILCRNITNENFSKCFKKFKNKDDKINELYNNLNNGNYSILEN